MEPNASYLSPGHNDVNEGLLVGARTLHGLVQTVSKVALEVPGTPHCAGQRKREHEAVTFCSRTERRWGGAELAALGVDGIMTFERCRLHTVGKGSGRFPHSQGTRLFNQVPFRHIRTSPIPRRPWGGGGALWAPSGSPCSFHNSHQQKCLLIFKRNL